MVANMTAADIAERMERLGYYKGQDGLLIPEEAILAVMDMLNKMELKAPPEPLTRQYALAYIYTGFYAGYTYKELEQNG